MALVALLAFLLAAFGLYLLKETWGTKTEGLPNESIFTSALLSKTEHGLHGQPSSLLQLCDVQG